MRNGRKRSAKLTQRLVLDKAFKSRPFVLVDVGARGGFSPQWSVFGDQLESVGFEPDAAECERINGASTDPNLRVYPFALHRAKGKHPFYITKFPNSSGFYPIDMSIAKRFPIWEPLSVDRVTDISTVDFDSFADEHGIGYVDFIKLDTEGSELDILEGALRTIDGSVLGVTSEALFAPWHSGQRVFADLDGFLRGQGFALYDLSILKFARNALPSFQTAVSSTNAVADYGQVVVGEVLYLRDPVKDIEEGRLDRWTEVSILKVACLYEIFNLPDSAIEVLQCAQRHGLLSHSAADVETFRDLIVEGATGKPYRDYLERFEAIKRRGFVTQRERFAPRQVKLEYYWRLLVLERHSFSWYYQKVKSRLGRRLGLSALTRASIPSAPHGNTEITNAGGKDKA